MCLFNQGTEDFKILLFIPKEETSSKGEKPAKKTKKPCFFQISLIEMIPKRWLPAFNLDMFNNPCKAF